MSKIFRPQTEIVPNSSKDAGRNETDGGMFRQSLFLGDLMDRHRRTQVKSYLVPFRDLPRPVFWFNDAFQPGTWSDLHAHAGWGELAYMASGYMVVCTELGNYLATPQRAVWIPPGLEHEWYLPEATRDCSLYILPAVLPPDAGLTHYQAREISPLVREMILALAPLPPEYDPGPVARLVDALLDQLCALPEVGFPLPMPKDRRLVVLCTSLLGNPDSQETLREWSQQLGMSERNLARLFQRETGESFGRWRQRIRLQHAVGQLEQGETVTTVALNCGYTSLSAFIAAFKKYFGTTPGQLKR